MEEIISFLNGILTDLNIKNIDSITIEEGRNIVKNLNEFLYTNYDGIGKTFELDSERDYISDYHKFWEKNCEKILSPSINKTKCEEVADVFHEIYINNKEAFYSLYSKEGLNDEEVCRIRFYTASQDFNGSRKFSEYAEIYKEDPSIFDKEYINSKPESFIRDLKFSKLSQTDKRIQFAKKSAEMLLQFKCEPFELLKKFNGDLLEIKNQLIKNQGMGFGNKKADMFIIDMVVLSIWKDYKNFEQIDVASDRNTMKVALRTGILKTEIPLVSSFLDIFCYQYSLIDQWCAKAWREVWNIWNKKYPKECIEGPSLLDYLVYRIIGIEFCNEKLAIFNGKNCGHVFKWHSSKNRKCQVCAKNKIYSEAKLINKVLPCQDEEGYIYIEKNKYVSGKEAVLHGYKECPLINVCNPMSNNFIKYNGPKSISILGRTGWSSTYTKRNEGGGGLMS